MREEIQRRASEWVVAFRDNLRYSILKFWMDHGVDRQYGGVLGWLDREGHPLAPGTKSVVQQARAVWTFSAAFRRWPEPAYREVASHALKFLRVKMEDAKNGGFYWLVNRDGSALDRARRPYGIGFVIYALAEYAQAFDDDSARQQALALFHWLDERNYDRVNGGYSSLPVVDRPRWIKTVTTKYLPGHKATDGQLHLMEAFTTLYKATGDTQVRERLNELVNLSVTRLFESARGYLHRNFNYRWKPWREKFLCSYGHDVEMSWLLMEAAGALAREQEDGIRNIALALVDHTLQFGLDDTSGGVCYAGPPAGPAGEKEKIWWVQVEALVGFLNAFQLSGDEKYWRRFDQQARFVFDHFVDDKFGEWHEKVDATGQFSGHKANPWKGPYHASRACLEVIRRLGNPVG